MRRLTIGFAAIVLLSGVERTEGTITTFSDRSSFETTVPGLSIEGFEAAFIAAPSVSFPGFRVTAETGNIESTTLPSYVSEGVRALTDSTSLCAATFTFDNPIYAFAIDINDFGTLGSGSLTVVNDTGSVDLTLAAVPPTLPGGNTIFFGVRDTEPFRSITIDRTTSGDRPGYDFLEFSHVPEPSTLVLLGIGALGLLAYVWRRPRVGGSPLCLSRFFCSRATSRPQIQGRCEMRALMIVVVAVVGVFAICLSPCRAASVEIVSYQFPGSVFTPTVTAPGISASNVNNTGSSAVIEPGNALPNSIFLRPTNAGSTTHSGAVANNEYLQFSVTPIGGRQINLASLTFDAARGGPEVPRGWVLRSSIDGFATDLSTAEIPTVQPNLTPSNVDLSTSAFQNLTNSTTFRVYGYVQAIGGQGLFFDNVTLNGTVVPEPSTLALLGIGAFGLLGWAWRRRKPQAQFASIRNGASTVVACLAVILGLAATPAFAVPIGKVAVWCDDDFNNADVQQKISGTGKFAQVDAVNLNNRVPTLSEALAYDAILMWGGKVQFSATTRTAVGNVLADYADSGRGVVTATFALGSGGGGPWIPAGRWNADRYHVMNPVALQSYGTRLHLGTVYYPSNPVMTGVDTFDGGSSSYYTPISTFAAGSVRVADWSNGVTLVAVKELPGLGRRVDLNFYPPSSDARSDFWAVGTDGDLLMANALQWAAPVPEPSTLVLLGIGAVGLLAWAWRRRKR